MSTIPGVPAPRFPRVPENIVAEEIIPVLQTIAARKQHSFTYPGLDLKPGKKYLVLCDSTTDRVTLDALAAVIRQGGATLDTIVLEGYQGMTEPVDLLDTMFSRNWFPAWAWEAISRADAVVRSAFLLTEYTPNVPRPLLRKIPIIYWYFSHDHCLPQFRSFPLELREAIDEKTWKSLVHARKFELTDLEGTELRWSATAENWQASITRDMERFGREYHPGHLMAPVNTGNAGGRLVTSAITFGGPVPRTTMTLEGGQVIGVEGEGKFPAVLRQSFAEYAHLKSPALPGPGINWWTTLAIGTSTKERVAAGWDRLTGSGRMNGWGAGHSRAGIIHSSIGEGVVSAERRIIRHVTLFFPTLVADGRTIIKNGRLLTLDDPEIVRLAERYGDPAELLREDWIPAVPGVNA